jgi:hypothetical protein
MAPKLEKKLQMRKTLNIYDIYQNSALSVIAIHSFILGYNRVAKFKDEKPDSPPLKYVFFVLPIIYDLESMESIKNELYTTLIKNKKLTLGLHERANKMSSQTFEALNLGLSKNIFNLSPDNYYIFINEEFMREFTIKLKFSNDVIRNIQTYSKRLGGIFAKKDEKILQLRLNISF